MVSALGMLMLAQVLGGGAHAEWVEAQPVCGVDFCDECGDCLACYGPDECVRSVSGHWWVVYADAAYEFRRRVTMEGER